jgi:hypothetical protein
MILDRHLSRAAIVSLAVAMFAAACSKDNPTPAPSCAFSVVQPTTTFGPEGGTGSATVTVTAGTGCNWTATSSATFITFTSGATGTGSGAANFTVAANTGAERTSTLTIAGTSVTITQRAAVAAPPPPTLSAPTPRSPSGGQDVELRPTLVVNNAVSTGAIGTVTYRFEVSDADTFPADPARTITQDGVAQGGGTTSWPIPRDLTAGTLYFWRARATNGTITTAFSAVERFRPGTGCTYALSTTSVSIPANGGTATINITTTSNCNWFAVSNDGFIVLTTPSSGTGNGSVSFMLAPSIGAARAGTLTIAGQTVTVNQDAVPNNGLVASFSLFDPATQASATTECRFRNGTGQPSTCVLQNTSVPLGTNSIVSQSWAVQYTYGTTKTLTGTAPTLNITDTCGQLTSTNDGVAQPLQVTLTVTDSNGTTAVVTSGSGLQPPLFVRLYTCGF